MLLPDLKLLKVLFKNKMESKAPEYLGLIERNFNDKDVDTLIEHFRDPERRKEFFKEYKEIEMLYEIISPDAFLRPFIDDYTTLSAIYDVVRKAYTKTVMVDRDFQRKTNALVQEHVGTTALYAPDDILPINAETLEMMKRRKSGDSVKVINLIKSIEKTAEENSDDPFLIAMAERARAVQESFEQRQTATAKALEDLLNEIERDELRKKEQVRILETGSRSPLSFPLSLGQGSAEDRLRSGRIAGGEAGLIPGAERESVNCRLTPAPFMTSSSLPKHANTILYPRGFTWIGPGRFQLHALFQGQRKASEFQTGHSGRTDDFPGVETSFEATGGADRSLH